MKQLIILPLLSSLVFFACSGDGTTVQDLSPGDGAAADLTLTDLGASDLALIDQERPDRGVHPDLVVQPLPALGKLSLVVNLGDSIAAAYGVSKASGYISLLHKNDDTAHPAFKGKDLTSRYPGITLSNRAMPGSESPAIPGQAAKAPTNTSGDTLVIISIGGNDMMFNYMALLDPGEARRVAARVQGNIKKVAAHFADKTKYPNKTTLLLFNVYEFTDGAGTMPHNSPVDKYCGMIKLLGPIAGKKAIDNMGVYNKEMMKFAAAEGLLMADLAAAFLGHGFNHQDKTSVHYQAADPALWFQTDCIHPNKAGHAGIRVETWRVLFGL